MLKFYVNPYSLLIEIVKKIFGRKYMSGLLILISNFVKLIHIFYFYYFKFFILL